MGRLLRRSFLGPVLLLWGCSTSGAASPFVGAETDAASDADAFAQVPIDAGQDAGAILGGPCLDDTQCNDGFDCTFDACGSDHRCQFVPDDARCQNGMFCDGVERCDPQLGCRAGSAQDCNDSNTCTIDSCVEATQSCQHVPRDADGDGNPDGHCVANGDCDDNDPTVYTGHPEICGNHKDDNCDGNIDESPCQVPSHDTCLDPLSVTGTGVYSLDTTGASFNYGASCVLMDAAKRRDVVAALEITGDPQDVDVVAEAPAGAIAVGPAGTCGDLSSELACGQGADGPANNRLARLHVWGLKMGNYPLYVWTDRDEQVLLHVTEGPATTRPTNETCGTAAPLALGAPVVANLVGTTRDLSSRCTFGAGDLVYSFTLAATSDVTVSGVALDNYGDPILSLRQPSCAAGSVSASDEITCTSAAQAKVLARALPQGTYYIAVSASAPTSVQVEVTASSPGPAPPDETCVGSPSLAINHTIDVSLSDHADDIDLSCALRGAVDAAYDLELAQVSDVLLVERIADGDSGAVALSLPACGVMGSEKACAAVDPARGQARGPVRASLRGTPAGSYRAIVESVQGDAVQLTAFVRPAVAPSLVPFADTCASPAVISADGGFFQGNTANASADYDAGCDTAGVGPGGAPDQILKLVLRERKRVVLDMQGSGYSTLLDVRKGETCPGTEVPGACSAGYGAGRSFLDVTLDPGTYWLQVDGFANDSGPWFLDVRTVAP